MAQPPPPRIGRVMNSETLAAQFDQIDEYNQNVVRTALLLKRLAQNAQPHVIEAIETIISDANEITTLLTQMSHNVNNVRESPLRSDEWLEGDTKSFNVDRVDSA